jgi:hypothetical protein
MSVTISPERLGRFLHHFGVGVGGYDEGGDHLSPSSEGCDHCHLGHASVLEQQLLHLPGVDVVAPVVIDDQLLAAPLPRQ